MASLEKADYGIYNYYSWKQRQQPGFIFVAFAVNSGTTAVAVLIQALLNAGDSIVLPRDVYYGNYALAYRVPNIMYFLMDYYFLLQAQKFRLLTS